MELATTRMSTRGQVVIPDEIRKRLGLKSGSQFIVVGNGDTVILKVLKPPRMEDFDDLMTEARRQAKQAGMKRSDVARATADVRSKV